MVENADRDTQSELIGALMEFIKSSKRFTKIIIHWVLGHKEIEGNELADKQAKEAASEMC